MKPIPLTWDTDDPIIDTLACPTWSTQEGLATRGKKVDVALAIAGRAEHPEVVNNPDWWWQSRHWTSQTVDLVDRPPRS